MKIFEKYKNMIKIQKILKKYEKFRKNIEKSENHDFNDFQYQSPLNKISFFFLLI